MFYWRDRDRDREWEGGVQKDHVCFDITTMLVFVVENVLLVMFVLCISQVLCVSQVQ